jgi:hypothetical protein
MMTRVPFDDPTLASDTYHDEPELYELLTSGRSKATFQWPPEWLKPLIKHGWRRRNSATQDFGKGTPVHQSGRSSG